MPVRGVAPGSPGEVQTSAAGRVDADGRFTITSVVPGRYRLTASVPADGWFLGSSAIEGQDSLDFPVEIKGAVSSAVVTFVDRRAELTGVVTSWAIHVEKDWQVPNVKVGDKLSFSGVRSADGTNRLSADPF